MRAALKDIRIHFGGLSGMLLVLMLGTHACNSSKFLAEDEELIVSQEVILDDRKQVENASVTAYELSTLTKQQPNGNFLFLFPREYIYLSSSRPQDTTRFDRFKRNVLGQPPAIYSDSLTQLAVENMTTYMKYRGYFDAEVYTELDHKKNQRIQLEYHVKAGPRAYIDSISYSSPQADIDSLLQLFKPNSLLKVSEPLNLQLFDQEKERIGRLLRNEGYAFFSNTYFDQLEIDTSRQSGLADIYLQILPPQNELEHKRYRIGNIEVMGDYSAQNLDAEYKLDTLYEGIRYLFRSDEPTVRLNTLLSNIFIRPGEYYSKAAIDRTNRQLSLLGVYRFVRITHRIDPARPDELDFVIQLTPNYKMELGVDFDLNYTNRLNNTGGTNLIGLSISPSYENRNVLGGGELLTTNLRAGVEFDPSFNSSASPFVNTVDLGAETNLYLPRFRDYLGLYRGLYRLPFFKNASLINPRFYEGMRERATTRLSLAYEYLLIRDLYAYTQATARYGYDYQRSPTTRYGISHLALDILIPSTQPRFDSILEENRFLQRSFGEQFFVSLLFREFNFQRTGRPNLRGQSLTILGNLEAAGFELLAANGLYNAFARTNTVFRPRSDASYAQYWRLETDLRYYHQYDPNRSIAARLNMGIGRPFGYGAALPYVKQFFVGGANSMRAWAPRGLGPGGFVDPESLNPDNNLRLYQTGDLKLEFNFEYRFKLFWQLRGAFFVDAGNVWSLEGADEDRCGAQFSVRKEVFSNCLDRDYFERQPFYRQVAIGAGTGIRIDLSYFIFRLDIAAPLRYNFPSFSGNRRQFQGPGDDPRSDPNATILERYYWNKFEGFRLRDLTFQLGLGYPF